MSASRSLPIIARGLLGAVVGGVVGYYAFFWIIAQGFYALVLPGALLGLCAGYAARGRSIPLAITCGIAGLGLGLFIEWKYAPFKADPSWVHFLTRIHELRPLTLIMIALGTFLSYRLALGMDTKSDSPPLPSSAEGL